MRFAIIDNKRVEAESGARGICPGCGEAVIAKCGKQRVPHWAHKANKVCDSWWEPETEWHREWKNKFPTDWQEVFLSDALTGEKHVADVRTSHGIVIEFQHSHITTEERISRESFYGNMIWVVDCSRLKRDYTRFIKGTEYFSRTNTNGFFLVDFPEECFPSYWLQSSVPVLFDFQNCTFPESVFKKPLWCLLPGKAGRYSVVAGISREDFIDRMIRFPQLFNDPAKDFVVALENSLNR